MEHCFDLLLQYQLMGAPFLTNYDVGGKCWRAHGTAGRADEFFARLMLEIEPSPPQAVGRLHHKQVQRKKTGDSSKR
jgi:hypothetical protein